MTPRVLVLFETSGQVRRAFQDAGCDAWSADLLPAADGAAQHIISDARALLARMRPGDWHLLVAHPPCTYLCGSSAWALGDGPYHQRVKPGTLVGAARRAARADALALVRAVLDAPVPCLCVENPIGAIGTEIEPASQYVQPWQFGHDASKRTGLWLRGLPLLRPTSIIAPRSGVWRDAGHRWQNQTDAGQNRLSPSDTRWQVRSETYAGIATAMAAQWLPFITRAATREVVAG